MIVEPPPGLVAALALRKLVAERTGEPVDLIKEWHFEDGIVRVTSYRTDAQARPVTSSSGRPLVRTTEYAFEWTQPLTSPSPQNEFADPEDDIVDPDLVDD